MSQPPVVEVVYDSDDCGEAIFRVSRRSRAAADRYFTYGERYRLEEVDDIQRARDKQFHANLRTLWQTLPETEDERFSSYDNFRGWCLHKTGYSSTTYFPCGSPENAEQTRAHLADITRGGGYSIIVAQGDVVAFTRPFSQKMKSPDMDAAQRRQSYTDVTDFADWFVREAHERQMQRRLEAPRKLLTHQEAKENEPDIGRNEGGYSS